MSMLTRNLVNTHEASKYLGIATQTLIGWRMNGKGPPFVRLGDKAIRYRIADLDKWVEDGEVKR